MNRCGLKALTNAEAVECPGNVCSDPVVSGAEEPPAARSLWLQLAHPAFPSPNVWMDAYLAAFTIALGAEMVTVDQDFKNFEKHGLKLQLIPT